MNAAYLAFAIIQLAEYGSANFVNLFKGPW